MKTIFLALQDPATRSWAPVARVDRDSDAYRLRYTKGAHVIEGFNGFVRMNDLESEYLSKELFPLLRNRVLPRTRPEFAQFASWAGNSILEMDYFEELSLTGGLRGTDSIELFPMPERTSSNTFDARFFVHGARYLALNSDGIVKSLAPGDRLYLASDPQNVHDRHALLLRTGEPVSLVGYVPRYFSHDFSSLLFSDPEAVRVVVEKVNPGAPPPYRVLCRFVAPWPASFKSCDSALFQLIESTSKKVVV